MLTLYPATSLSAVKVYPAPRGCPNASPRSFASSAPCTSPCLQERRALSCFQTLPMLGTPPPDLFTFQCECCSSGTPSSSSLRRHQKPSALHRGVSSAVPERGHLRQTARLLHSDSTDVPRIPAPGTVTSCPGYTGTVPSVGPVSNVHFSLLRHRPGSSSQTGHGRTDPETSQMLNLFIFHSKHFQ